MFLSNDVALQARPNLSFEGCRDLVEHSQRIFAGLRAVHAVSGTGVGRSQNLNPAREVVRAAMNYRHILFSSVQKKELESWVQKEKDKDRDLENGDCGLDRKGKERSRGKNREGTKVRCFLVLSVGASSSKSFVR